MPRIPERPYSLAPTKTPASEPTTVIATEPVSDADTTATTDDTTEAEEVIVEKADAEEDESYASAAIAGAALIGVLVMIF